MSLLRDLFTNYTPINALHASFGMHVISKGIDHCVFSINPTYNVDRIRINRNGEQYTLTLYKNDQVVFEKQYDQDQLVEMYNTIEKRADILLPF